MFAIYKLTMPAVRRRFRGHNCIVVVVVVIDAAKSRPSRTARISVHRRSRPHMHRSVTYVGLLERVRQLQVDVSGERIHVTVGRNYREEA